MRPSGRHSLSAASDRSAASVFRRGIAAPPGRFSGAAGGQGRRMKSPFAERERERLIAAGLPHVGFDGWSHRALRVAGRNAGVPVGEAMALFPRGAPDLVTGFSRWVDRQMLDRLENA